MYRAAVMARFVKMSASGSTGTRWMGTGYMGASAGPMSSFVVVLTVLYVLASRLQVRILQRAMRMLHPDGRIVYSTCSLNPIENEAVVAEALRTISGEDSTFSRMRVGALNPSIFLLDIRCGPVDFEIVDVSEMLPSLVRRPGLTKWVPSVDRDLKFYETYDEYIRSLPANRRADTRLGRSHWPPTDVQGLNLERW